MTLYYEDLSVGWTETYGSYRMTEAGIVAFAEQFDPQPMHVDPDAAAETVHGGLGIDDLRFHEAVRPGDVLAARLEVTAKRPSESNPGVGVVAREIEVVREDREGDAEETTGAKAGIVVCSWQVTILVA